MQVKSSPWGQTDDLGVRSKGQISINSITKSISKIFIQNFVCILTSKRYDTYRTEFLFYQCWGVKNLSVGICDGTPSTARSS